MTEGALRPRDMLFSILEDGVNAGEFLREDLELILVFVGGGMARSLAAYDSGREALITPERTADLQRIVRHVLGVKEKTPGS